MQKAFHSMNNAWVLLLLIFISCNRMPANTGEINIYHVTLSLQTKDAGDFNFPPPLTVLTAMQDIFPEAKRLCKPTIPIVVAYENNRFYETLILFSDIEVLGLFETNFITGDSANFLEDPKNIAISVMIARKYFGDEIPIGKKLTLNDVEFTVAAIVDNAKQLSGDLEGVIFCQIAALQEFTSSSLIKVDDFDIYLGFSSGVTSDVMKQSLPKGTSGFFEGRKVSIALESVSKLSDSRKATNRTFSDSAERWERLIICRISPNIPVTQFESLRGKIIQHPMVEAMSYLSGYPTIGEKATLLSTPDKASAEFVAQVLFVDHHFLETFGCSLKNGKPEVTTPDHENVYSVLLNEQAAKKLGGASVIDTRINLQTNLNDALACKVSGILRNEFQDADPFILVNEPSRFKYFAIRVRPQNLLETIRFIESIAGEFSPDAPFEYSFLDELFLKR